MKGLNYIKSNGRYVDLESEEGQEAFSKTAWMDIPIEQFRASSVQSSAKKVTSSADFPSMKNFDKFLNAAEAIGYLESATKEGDTYTLIGCGKSLQIKEGFHSGAREVLLWSKSEPTKLRKVVGASLEKVLPRLVVQHFTGVKDVMYTDHNNHKHIFEDVGFFPVSVHSGMTRFSDAIGRKWICIASGSDVPNITLAFYKLLYDGRTEMSAMMMPKLQPLDDVKVVKSGVGGEKVSVLEMPTLPEPSDDFIVSSIDDFKRALPDVGELVMFPHQGDVPDYGYAIKKDSGMVVSSADQPFIASAERKIREFIGSFTKRKSGLGFKKPIASTGNGQLVKSDWSDGDEWVNEDLTPIFNDPDTVNEVAKCIYEEQYCTGHIPADSFLKKLSVLNILRALQSIFGDAMQGIDLFDRDTLTAQMRQVPSWFRSAVFERVGYSLEHGSTDYNNVNFESSRDSSGFTKPIVSTGRRLVKSGMYDQSSIPHVLRNLDYAVRIAENKDVFQYFYSPSPKGGISVFKDKAGDHRVLTVSPYVIQANVEAIWDELRVQGLLVDEEGFTQPTTD